MASNNQSIRQLADAIFDIDRRLTGVERTPQLGNSSLEDTGINVYDSENNLTVTVGKQPDGTYGATPVRGPVPPAPEGVDAEGDASVVRASWAGTFRDAADKPLDFEAVEVLVDGVVLGALHDPLGGSLTVPAISGEREVSFRTLSQAGMHSEAVGHVTVTVEPRVSEQMLELGEDLTELRDVVLPELADELDTARGDLQQKLDAANQRIDDIIVDGGGGAGNFTTYSVNEPSGEGTGSGDQWFRVVNGEVLGQWQWDGETWAPITLTDAVIAGIDLSKIVSNGNLSEVVASKMFTDIFTANKITSQEIAAGSITTEKISSEGIIADVIQGGSFVGETFEGGEFVGGAFRTSEAEPGEVLLSDTAFRDPTTNADGPGMRITPQLFEGYDVMPSIGPTADSMVISGGTSTTGGRTFTTINPSGSATVHESVGKSASSVVNDYEAKLDFSTDSGAGSSVSVKAHYTDMHASDGARTSSTAMTQPDRIQLESRTPRPENPDSLRWGRVQVTPQKAFLDSENGTAYSSVSSSPGSASLTSKITGDRSATIGVGQNISLRLNDSSNQTLSKIGLEEGSATIRVNDGPNSNNNYGNVSVQPRNVGISSNSSEGRATVSVTDTLTSLYARTIDTETQISTVPKTKKIIIETRTEGETGRIVVDNKNVELSTVAGLTTKAKVNVSETDAYLYSNAGGRDRYLTVDAAGVWAKQDSEAVSLIPQVRPFQYSAQWNADQSPAPIMVQHLPGGKLCQAQIRIQNLSGSKLSLPYDTWVQLNYNPIPSDLRGGYTDYIEVTLPQLNARGRVEMNYSTGRIRVKALEKDSNGNGITVDWHNNNSIWFPMRWFSPDSASL